MSSLNKFYQKKVQIIDIDNEVWEGFVDLYFASDENDSGIESIAIDTGSRSIEFGETEIKSIKEIE